MILNNSIIHIYQHQPPQLRKGRFFLPFLKDNKKNIFCILTNLVNLKILALKLFYFFQIDNNCLKFSFLLEYYLIIYNHI